VCPDRRDLLHVDLLHANVLVTPDATDVEAVFSWKCSLLGDFLFDTAWCTFWAPWHPGIAAARVSERVTSARWATADPTVLVDAGVRHHCYELYIGATHIGWCASIDDEAGLRDVIARTEEVLETGPRHEVPA
jgi:aminoglycoside phosphotransferase (APT) family kinase protein